MHNEGRATAKNCMQYKYDMQGGGARRRREARGGTPPPGRALGQEAGAGKGVGTTPGTPWHQRVPASGGPDIESVGEKACASPEGPRDYKAASLAASAADVWRAAAAARTSLMLCVNLLMRLRIDLAFSRCKVTPRFW